jgi:HAD superfamily hydrolase (TIGR01509 family)
VAIKGVIFDLDGTVVENSYDWPKIREELGNGNIPILSYLSGLEEPERSRKWAILERHEAEQTARSKARAGIRELLAFLRSAGLQTALVTNNSRRNADELIARFRLSFDLVVTRESGLWKPSGAPFRQVLASFGIGGGACCVVGDTRFDVLAASEAGIGFIFLIGEEASKFAGLPVEVFSGVPALKARLEELL